MSGVATRRAPVSFTLAPQHCAGQGGASDLAPEPTLPPRSAARKPAARRIPNAARASGAHAARERRSEPARRPGCAGQRWLRAQCASACVSCLDDERVELSERAGGVGLVALHPLLGGGGDVGAGRLDDACASGGVVNRAWRKERSALNRGRRERGAPKSESSSSSAPAAGAAAAFLRRGARGVAAGCARGERGSNGGKDTAPRAGRAWRPRRAGATTGASSASSSLLDGASSLQGRPSSVSAHSRAKTARKPRACCRRAEAQPPARCACGPSAAAQGREPSRARERVDFRALAAGRTHLLPRSDVAQRGRARSRAARGHEARVAAQHRGTPAQPRQD